VHADRALFFELISAHTDQNNDLYSTAAAVNRQIRRALRVVQDVGVRTTESRELSHVDGPVTVASIASMLFGMVLFDKWVYPAGSRPAGRERMINEITQTVYYGIARQASR
jgi:hypothetical protein